MDGEGDKEDILEEEAGDEDEEKKKVTKGAQVCRTFGTANFVFNSGPARPASTAIIPNLCWNKLQYGLDSIAIHPLPFVVAKSA